MTDLDAAVPLSSATLTSLGDLVRVPGYDRTGLRPSIVHIGVGGFHRAHLATYIDELCATGNTDWAIVGFGILQADSAMAGALGAQDALYTLIERGTATTRVQVVGSMIDYIHAYPGPEPLRDQIADPQTQIVSMTITEGGYPVDDRTGRYLPDSANAGESSAFGVIAAGLDARRRSNGKPITILSCDNIMTNGDVARAATLGEAARYGDELASWIEGSVSFPNSMVDRITPVTAQSDIQWLQATHQIADRWPVVAEPFRQWVVEDAFAGERPPLEQLDIIVTDDVEPYEFMKLRLLNAGHSCLAYLSALDGIQAVDAAMAEPAIALYLRAFLQTEAKPVLPEVAGIDVDAYIDTLIERFSNPNVGDQIARLCLDGSAKFPKFLLPTVRAQLSAEGSVQLAALALAGWCEYLLGSTSQGEPIDVASDPQLELAQMYASASREEPRRFLDFADVFGSDLASSPSFVQAFESSLRVIRASGIRSAIEAASTGV